MKMGRPWLRDMRRRGGRLGWIRRWHCGSGGFDGTKPILGQGFWAGVGLGFFTAGRRRHGVHTEKNILAERSQTARMLAEMKLHLLQATAVADFEPLASS